MADNRYNLQGGPGDSGVIRSPDVPRGGTGLGNQFSQIINLESQGLNEQWRLQDETIQLNLLKGGSPQDAYNQYMELAKIAGASGQELASVTFQQKAQMALDAASSGGGGGGRGGGGGGVSSKERKAAYDSAVANLEISEKELVKNLRENYENGIKGFALDENGNKVPITDQEVAILNQELISQFNAQVNEIDFEFAPELLGNDGAPISGWSTRSGKIEKYITGDTGELNGFYKDVAGDPQEGFTPLDQYEQGYYDNVKDGNYVRYFGKPSVDSSFNLPKGSSAYNYRFIRSDNVDALEQAGYRKLDITDEQGHTVPTYLLPTEGDPSDPNATLVFNVPRNVSEGNPYEKVTYDPLLGEWYRGSDITDENREERKISLDPESNSPLYFPTELAKQQYQALGGTLPEVPQEDQQPGIGGKFLDLIKQSPYGAAAKGVKNVYDLVAGQEAQAAELPPGADPTAPPEPQPQEDTQPSPLDIILGKSQGVQDQFNLLGKGVLDRVNPIAQAQDSYNRLRDILTRRKEEEAQAAAERQAREARNAVPIDISRRPGSPTFNGPANEENIARGALDIAKKIAAGSSPQQQRRQDPLDLRRQASLIASKGYNAFSRFLRGIF